MDSEPTAPAATAPSDALDRRGSPELARHLRVSRRSHYSLAFLAIGAFLVLLPLVPALTVVSIPLVLIGAIGVSVKLLRYTQVWGTTFMDAEAHLKAYELDEAEGLLTDLSRKFRLIHPTQIVCAFHLSLIARLRGDLDRARAVHDELLQSGWLRARAGSVAFMSAAVYGEAALVRALDGDLDEAEALLVEGRERTSAVRAPVLAFPEAVVRARRERWADCVDAIASDRDRARGLVSPHDMRAVAIVEALALARLAHLGYREGARDRRPEQAIADAKPARPGEFAYFGRSWPEMKELLDAHF